MRRTSLLVILLTLALVARVSAQSPTGQTFKTALLTALGKHDIPAVQALFSFPARVTMPAMATSLSIKDAAALNASLYDAIFTPATICAIEKGDIRETADTLTIGNGVVVARKTGGTSKITALKVTGAPSQHDDKPKATIDARFRGATRQLAGNLQDDDVDVYLVQATKGTLLQARLERFQGNIAGVRVRDAKGNPVEARADGRRAWAGTIPETGTYRLEVAKQQVCEPPITYLLTVAAR